MTGEARGFRREGLALIGLIALVILVAIAAVGRGPGSGDDAPSVRAPTLLADYLATIALLLVPLGVILFVFSMFQRRDQKARGGGSKRSLLASFMVMAALFSLAFVLVGRVGERGDPGVSTPSATSPTGTQTGTTAAVGEEPEPYRARFRWLPLFVLGSLVFGVAIAASAYALRRRRAVEDPAALAAALSDVLAETLDDLRREPDPRVAVIRTYARMERTLAARGLPRRAFETPLEYLTRALDAVQAGAHSVRRLTRLFERARFSPHDIDARMKDDAIDALVELRTELEVAA